MAMTDRFNIPMRAKRYFEDKLAFTMGPVELRKALKEERPVVIVDVRRKEDFEKGHIPGAVSLPEEEWGRQTGLRKGVLNVIYCYTQQCRLAARAALRFAEKGFPVCELDGGMKTWRENGFEVEKSDAAKKGRMESPRVDAFTTARMFSHH